MINIVTIHHKNSNWIDIQAKYLKQYTNEEFRVFAGFDSCGSDFKYKPYSVDTLQGVAGGHTTRMNHLVEKVLNTANEDDLLVFIDGDAFPIFPWVENIREALKDNAVVAAQRSEIGTKFPHPLFLCTTVGFWKNKKMKWQLDYKGQHYPTPGASFIEEFKDMNVKWHPLEKRNKITLHTIFFAVYGDIYHHGAGFRNPITGIDYYREGWPAGGPLKTTFDKVRIDNEEVSKFVYNKIKKDSEFPARFFIGIASETSDLPKLTGWHPYRGK